MSLTIACYTTILYPPGRLHEFMRTRSMLQKRTYDRMQPMSLSTPLLQIAIFDPSCRCEILRGGMAQYLTPMGPSPLSVNPLFEIGPLEPRFSEWLVFEGISVDEYGKQHYLDVSVAYKRAVLNCIHYLAKFGYSFEQARSIWPVRM